MLLLWDDRPPAAPAGEEVDLVLRPLFQQANILLEGGDARGVRAVLGRIERLLAGIPSLARELPSQDWLVLDTGRNYSAGFEPARMLSYSGNTVYYKHLSAVHRQYGRLALDGGDPLTALSHMGVVFDYTYKYLLMSLSPSNATVSQEEVSQLKGELYPLITDMSNALVQLGRHGEALYLLDRYILLNMPRDKRAYQRALTEVQRSHQHVPHRSRGWVDAVRPSVALAHFLKRDLEVPSVQALRVYRDGMGAPREPHGNRHAHPTRSERYGLCSQLEACIGRGLLAPVCICVTVL